MKSKGGSTVIAMPLEKADLSQWTFTCGDSMGNYLSKQNVSKFLSAAHALTGTAMDDRKLAEVSKKATSPKTPLKRNTGAALIFVSYFSGA